MPVIGLNMLRGPKDVSLPLELISDPYFHVMPSMGPIVSDVNLHGQQNLL